MPHKSYYLLLKFCSVLQMTRHPDKVRQVEVKLKPKPLSHIMKRKPLPLRGVHPERSRKWVNTLNHQPTQPSLHFTQRKKEMWGEEISELLLVVGNCSKARGWALPHLLPAPSVLFPIAEVSLPPRSCGPRLITHKSRRKEKSSGCRSVQLSSMQRLLAREQTLLFSAHIHH